MSGQLVKPKSTSIRLAAKIRVAAALAVLVGQRERAADQRFAEAAAFAHGRRGRRAGKKTVAHVAEPDADQHRRDDDGKPRARRHHFGAWPPRSRRQPRFSMHWR